MIFILFLSIIEFTLKMQNLLSFSIIIQSVRESKIWNLESRIENLDL